MAKKAMRVVKYNGEIASVEFREEYSIIISDAFSKKSEAIKYPIKAIPLPVKVRIHTALSSGGRDEIFLIILNSLQKY